MSNKSMKRQSPERIEPDFFSAQFAIPPSKSADSKFVDAFITVVHCLYQILTSFKKLMSWFMHKCLGTQI